MHKPFEHQGFIGVRRATAVNRICVKIEQGVTEFEYYRFLVVCSMSAMPPRPRELGAQKIPAFWKAGAGR